jgi:enediyne biosynthesis protein E4
VADFDGDGQEDLFLAQNFFGTPSEGWRQDAGRGLLLKGDGSGGLKPMPGQESGIRIYGEQRGCAVCDYDGDGRVDLVVAQNGQSTRVLHNVGAKPGLRLRLKGPSANPTGIGAVARVRHQGKLGPARELHAGSGYWSQDSAIQVVSADGVDQLWVRWPGGKVVNVEVPPDAREVEVNEQGLLKMLR